MKKKKTLLLSFAILTGFFFALISCAQDSTENEKNFSLSVLQSDSSLSYKAKQGGQLDSYIGCLASVRNDVSVCANASDSDQCKKDFLLLHKFYRELFLTGSVNADMIMSFIKRGEKMSPQEVQIMAEGFLSKDATICEKNTDKNGRKTCIALMKRDISQCSDLACKDRLHYIEAMEKIDLKKCNSISDEKTRMMCIGGITMDEEHCKQCQGFKTFIKEASQSQQNIEPYVFKKEDMPESVR